MRLTEKARQFAVARHGAQRRKYTGEPYTNHTESVAKFVRMVGSPEEVIAAAHLHDVLEDTLTTEDELKTTFGPVVTKLVVELTNVYRKEVFPELNRAQRKALERDRLANISPYAQTIKVADLIDNALTVEERDPQFAKVYLQEKAELLKVLTLADPFIRALANIGEIECN